MIKDKPEELDSNDPMKTQVYEYLDDLRESGHINMMGAASYIKSNFKISNKEANKYLLSWIKDFKV